MQRLLPPTLLLLSFVLIALTHALLPIAQLIPWPINLLGIPIIVFGLGIAVAGSRIFKRAKTNIHTFKRPDKLVTTGLFIYSRNPMYLGFALAVLGAALFAATLTPWIVAVVFCAILDRWYVQFEEEMLMQTFGGDYEAYKGKVRRWI